MIMTAADVNVNIATNKDVDVAPNMDDYDPCIFRPITNVGQIFE
jgi:hypothetical protein